MQTPVEPSQESAQAPQPQTASVNPSSGSHWWNCAVWRTLRLLLLAITVIALWLTIEDRWGSKFRYPTRYDYDAHYVLGMMKLAQEGDLGLFTHIYTKSLGAPFTGQLNDFPQTERVIIWLGGQMARVVGLMPAGNIMLLLSAIVAAISFYSALRLWKVSRLPSWFFAVTYAFLPNTVWSLEHLGVIFTGLLPLQLYVLWYIATAQTLSWGGYRLKLALFISLLSGVLNVYWIFLFLQLYALALLCRLIKRRGSLIKASIPFVGTLLTVGLFLGSFIVYKKNHGSNPNAVVRSYFDVERWSLKPIDLFMAPKPRRTLPVISILNERYRQGEAINIGEPWGAYIGVLSGFGLLFLLFEGGRRQIERRSSSIPCLVAIWLILYTIIGGIHSVFSLAFDFYNIRGLNRYSTAIATIGLLYLVFVINRVTLRWNIILRFLVISLCVLFGLRDQTANSYTYPRSWHPTQRTGDKVERDRELVALLEGCLMFNSMVYILPVIDFPEAFWGRGAFRGAFHHYHAMRPFLYSTKLRYSYGSHKGRQGADWQLDVQELPAGEIARTLESYGFAGILLNRKGYEDRGEQLLAELAEAGWPMEFEQGIDNEWVFIRLTPAENPVLPTQTPYAVTQPK